MASCYPVVDMHKVPLAVFGFKDDIVVARAAARHFGVRPHIITERHYPYGELSVRIHATIPARAVVAASIDERPQSLFRTLVLAHALRGAGTRRIDLVAPWIAYGRQDKRSHDGTGAGLALAGLLAQSFDRIVTLDAHSASFRRAFRGRLTNILPDPRPSGYTPTLVVAPDRGSRDRARATATTLGVPDITLEKKRSSSDVRTAFVRPTDRTRAHGAAALLVDDMADTGDTLIAAIRTLRSAEVSSVLVQVTHAFDLAKLRARLRAHHAGVHAVMDHSRGTVDPRQLALLLETIHA